MASPLRRSPGYPTRPRAHAEIDADLARWTDAAARIGAAIEGLTQDPVFLRLKAQARLGALGGATQVRGEAAVKAAEHLWTLYLALDRRLAEAAELRQSGNPFGREERFEKIDAILRLPCVSLPRHAGDPTPSPLAQMTLEGEPDRLATLAEVRAAMEPAFDAVRDTVIAAGGAWAGLHALKDLRDRIAAVKAEADALGCPHPGTLAEAARRLDAAEASLDADPIGAVDASSGIVALLEKADTALASARADRLAATAFLAAASGRLSDIGALRQSAIGIRAQRIAKITDPSPASDVPPDPRPELEAWLTTLARTARDGRPHAALIGAAAWTRQADAAAAALTAISAEDRRLLDARDDLRGRFSALAAKAEARAAGGRLTPEASALLQATRALLFAAATPLPQAIALLRQCESL